MSILSSNSAGIESISVKGLHNRAVKLLKSISEDKQPPQGLLYFIEIREDGKAVMGTITIHIPKNIMDNPELTDENIQTMKKYLYDRLIDTGIPPGNLYVMCDPIKEKDCML